MAFAALVSLSQTIDLTLNYHQDAISPQVKDQIISINEYVVFLQALLENFPDKTNSLEAIIRAVTHAAEDIIDFFMSEHILKPRYAVRESSVGLSELLRRDGTNSSGFMLHSDVGEDIFEPSLWKSLWSPIESSLAPPISKWRSQPKAPYEHLRYDFRNLKEATEEIESIAEILMKMKSSIIVKDERSGGDSTAVNSSSSRVAAVHKDAMVGFENDILEIKHRLCVESSKQEIIPVVGMGGIGKTTLARNVFDDPLIMEHFQIREWVTVSQDCRIEEIVSCLLISMKVVEAKSESMRPEHVYQNLKGRRYLIVLDDIWSIKAWDDLKMMFPDDGNNSRIMITTRLSDVASYIDSSSPVHQMNLMDKNLSWNLLQQKVFMKEQCPVELEYSGKVIAESCRGLPLAIVAISGILSSIDRTATAWWNIAKNVTSVISSANNEQFDKILSLSYTHLPHHLRPCFLYMGRLRGDCEVRASKLIKLWGAEGFLKPNGCNKSSEETAEEYLVDLVKRSLVLVQKRKSDGRIKSLRMHDLMREMCIRIAEEEIYLRQCSVSFRQGYVVHHLSTIPSHLDFPENFYGLTIRTMLLSGLVRESALFSIRYFRLLRILDLLDAYSASLPAQILELIHLRYLAFNGVFSFQVGISNLQNLQSFIYSNSPYGKYFPYYEYDFLPFQLEIWSMPQLRNLVIRSGFCFCLPPHQERERLCRLENLQTLSLAINFICTPEILKSIPNLKKLEISYRGRDEEEDYLLHNLVYLQQLENFSLMIHSNFSSPEKVRPAFPRTLKKLTLSGVKLRWEDMEIVGSLPNLQVLKLKDYACVGDTWKTTEGEFPRLKFLLIDESELQDWITECSHFPNLKCLVLHRCWNLKEIPNDIGEVPTLELIEVDDENLLASAKQIQEDQQSYGNEATQVRFVERKTFSHYKTSLQNFASYSESPSELWEEIVSIIARAWNGI